MKKNKKNDICSCGSGKKLKNCHDKPNKQSSRNFKEDFTQLHRDKRIKNCAHPNKKECSEKIIKAHSIQNNKIIKQLSKNGKVYMNKPKSQNPFAAFTEWGRKEATTFTGFCSYHDKVLFQPIEDNNFNKSDEHVFLYTYRCLTQNLHNKKEDTKFYDLANQKFSPSQESILLHQGIDSAVSDFRRDKEIFDHALLIKNFSVIDYIIWEFDYPISFAGSAFEAPTRDLKNRTLQDLTMLDSPIAHLFTTIFPENERSYCIISWLKADYDILSPLIKQLQQLNDIERKYYLSHRLVKTTDNLIFSPILIDSMLPYEIENFGFLSQGSFLLEAIFDEPDYISNISVDLSDPMYDLFKKF